MGIIGRRPNVTSGYKDEAVAIKSAISELKTSALHLNNALGTLNTLHGRLDEKVDLIDIDHRLTRLRKKLI